MVRDNTDDKNGIGREQTQNNTNHSPMCEFRVNHSCGALELVYPEANIYSEIFRRYVPEIADYLVGRREVRFLVESAYNVCLVTEPLGAVGGVSEETILELAAIGEQLTTVLWEVCDQLADVYRMQHGYTDAE